MFLKTLKPSWRKLIVAAGIYFMVLLSVGADKAIQDVSRKHLASRPEVQRYLAEIKSLYGSADVEVKVNELRAQLLENTSQLCQQRPCTQGVDNQLDTRH